YVLNSSLSWSDEVAMLIFGWAAFLFIASAYLHDKHVNVDFLVQRFTPLSHAAAALIAEGLSGGYLIPREHVPRELILPRADGRDFADQHEQVFRNFPAERRIHRSRH